MPDRQSQLFREESIKHRRVRLEGRVNIALPLSWQLIGFLLIISLSVTVLFISIGTYARVTNVNGSIVMDKGIAVIVPSRPGTIKNVLVSEGQKVEIGETLITVKVEEHALNGTTAYANVRNAMIRQEQKLDNQRDFIIQASQADRERLYAQQKANFAAISALKSQILDQKKLIETAEIDYISAQKIADRGYISKRDINQRESVVLTRRQNLSQLEQNLYDKQMEIIQGRHSIEQASSAARSQAANVESSRESLSQQQAQTELAEGYSIVSPMSGTITALTARQAQTVSSDKQLMMILPNFARPKVELYAPASAAAFLEAGQEIRISVDAYPYQTFGTVTARLESISGAAIMQQTADGPVPTYLLVATISKPWIFALGRKQHLLPGMTVSARIITEKRSLIRWLFDPLFAVTKR